MTQTRSLSERPALWAGILAGVLVFLFHLPFAQNSLFFDDAADYIRAADGGFVPLWLNTNSKSPLQLAHMRRDDAAFRVHPWDSLYVSNDNAALRHFHVPFSFYGMRLVRAISPFEQAERLFTSGVTALTSGWMTFLLADLSVPLLLALPLALLAGVQSRYIETSVDPTPHSWYMLFALTFLFYFARYLSNQRSSYLYLAAASLALAFATLEFSVELIASVPLTLAAVALISRRHLPRWCDVRVPLLRAAGLFLAVTTVVWPGGWLRGGYLESYGVLSATVLFKNKSAFGEKLTADVVYQAVFARHAVLLALTILCLAGILFLLVKRGLSTTSVVFASYTFIAFALGLADHFRLSTYISEFLLFLIATTGIVLVDLLRTLPVAATSRKVMLASIVLLLAVGCVSEWRERNTAMAFRPWLRPIIDGLQANVPPGEAVLVNDNWEALALYLPSRHYEPTIDKHSAMPRSTTRNRHTHYVLLDGATQPLTGSHWLASYPAYPGRVMVLWTLGTGPESQELAGNRPR